jgi:hypothetical protein
MPFIQLRMKNVLAGVGSLLCTAPWNTTQSLLLPIATGRKGACPEGSAPEDWFRAEQDFRNKLISGLLTTITGPVLRLPH